MGFQRSWAYKELVEFEFDNGKLVKKTDHSDTAQKLREILDSSGVNPAHPEGENIEICLRQLFVRLCCKSMVA